MNDFYRKIEDLDGLQFDFDATAARKRKEGDATRRRIITDPEVVAIF
jgi:hypothetical protein